MSDTLPSRRENGARILSLFLPRLPTDLWLRAERAAAAAAGSGASPDTSPAAIVEKIGSAQQIVAVNLTAARQGLRVGTSLADARAAYPGLRIAEADRAAERRLLETIADWCDRYTPLVMLDPPDGLFLDISGCAHLFARGKNEGEALLLADCLRRLEGQGFAVAGAIASTAGAAWAYARFGKGGIVAAGSEREALFDLPVVALRLDEEQAALLGRLGLKRVGELVGKPRAALAARFGIGLVRRLDQALGMEDEALRPRRPPPRLIAERRFIDPLVETEAILATLGSLAQRLEPALRRQGIGARMFEAVLFRIDGAVTRLALGMASPVRDPQTILRLFRERLVSVGGDLDAGFGFEMVRLVVPQAETLEETQIDLSGEGDAGVDFAHLVDRLGARLGTRQITRFETVDTHIPERAVRTVPLTAAGNFLEENGRAKLQAGEEKARASFPLAEAWPERPLKLFHRPERVEVVAEVPEGPPLRFRWRRVLHEVARAEGPERIAPEWWRPADNDSPTRDYFRVEDAEGRRFWLFRAGLYGRESVHPAWYVHGLFA